MRLYLASRVSTKNESMAPLHVATTTVQRELYKFPIMVDNVSPTIYKFTTCCHGNLDVTFISTYTGNISMYFTFFKFDLFSLGVVPIHTHIIN